jgi:DNA polymerase I-like protein with 3'-5' exonuclease and polymerase domains
VLEVQHVDLEAFFSGQSGGFSADIAGRSFPGSIWDGEQLSGPFAFDTETHLIEPGFRVYPRLVLASASDGKTHVIVEAGRVAEFIGRHEGRHVIFHNASFDAGVLARHVGPSVWKWLDGVRVSDTMILARIIDLFETGTRGRLDLGTLVERYTDLLADKEDPYRTRYAEIDGIDLRLVPKGFLEYALADAIVTRKLHDALQKKATELLRPFTDEIDQSFAEQLGPFAEDVHAKASIVLDLMQKRGLRIDRGRRDAAREKATEELTEKAAALEEIGGEQLFKTRKKTGERLLTPSGVPRVNQKLIRARLAEIAAENSLKIARTAGGEITLRAEEWDQHRKLNGFVGAYLDFESAAKQMQFFQRYPGDEVRPTYQACVKTARTSCSGPNIQQLPALYRKMIVPRPGHVFVTSDYSFVELVTLAAHCDFKLGYSELGNAIRENQDPHCSTAAKIAKAEYEDFVRRYRDGDAEAKAQRQAAKACNFGLPGGLGAQRLRELARANYHVELSAKEAEQLRDLFLYGVDPAIGEWLELDRYVPLAHNLRGNAVDLEAAIEPSLLIAVEKIAGGVEVRKDGTPYAPAFIDAAWEFLIENNHNPALTDRLSRREGGPELRRDLGNYPAVNFAGFARGRCAYCDRKNFPFQSLAALGAKVALWDLHVAGLTPAIFVHDEVVIEMPEESAKEKTIAKIESTLIAAMQRFTRGLPVKVETTVAHEWSK